MALGIVILAAGNGTRMATDLPKVLHPLAGVSMIQRVVNAAKRCQPAQLAIVHGAHADAIKEHLAHEQVDWVEQSEPLGTGHAVLQALPMMRACSRIMVLFADTPCISSQALQAFLTHTAADGLGVITAHYDDPGHLGRIVRDCNGDMLRVVEYVDASAKERTIHEVFTGVIAAPYDFLCEALPCVSNDNQQSEYYLPDALPMWLAKKQVIQTYLAPLAWRMRGVNNLQELSALERAYQRHTAHVLQAQGVQVQDPDRFDCRGVVQAERGAYIGAGVVLEGEVRLAKHVRVEEGAILKNTSVGQGSCIRPYSVIEGSVVKAGVTVGPFAHIRPGCCLDDGSKVGAFVEVKNTHLGAQSKACHLAYLGDSKIGCGVNIGAGVVTCNYDGQTKHTTHIHDGAFIGTGCYLVAPVTVEQKAYVGAGTVVRKSVAAKSLAVSLPPVKVFADWSGPGRK